MQELRRLIVYHSLRTEPSARMHVLLQVELTHARIAGAKRITRAVLVASFIKSPLSAWQEPASVGEEVHLLLEGAVDVHMFRTSPHRLILLGGEEGSEKIAEFDNILLR